MKKIDKKLTIIKYGSNTLVNKSANNEISVDTANMKKHGEVISKIDNPVIIVSSGAVAFGKTLGNKFEYIKDEIIRKRIFSALGNPHLSMNWDNAISNKQVLQSLLTHRDLISEISKGKILEIIYALFGNIDTNNVVIQVNDNDFITDEELTEMRNGDFGDNDETTALLAILCSSIFEKVDVIINTSRDGVLENGKVVSSICATELTNDYIEKICSNDKNYFGTGGMNNKLKIMRDLVNDTSEIDVCIINGKKPDQLQSVLNGESVGTRIY